MRPWLCNYFRMWCTLFHQTFYGRLLQCTSSLIVFLRQKFIIIKSWPFPIFLFRKFILQWLLHQGTICVQVWLFVGHFIGSFHWADAPVSCVPIMTLAEANQCTRCPKVNSLSSVKMLIAILFLCLFQANFLYRLLVLNNNLCTKLVGWFVLV